TVVAYFYRPTHAEPPKPPDNRLGLKPFDPNGRRPADLARTTTTDGHAVDFIVRRERGTINRAIYEIEFLTTHASRCPIPGPLLRDGTAFWSTSLAEAAARAIGKALAGQARWMTRLSRVGMPWHLLR